MHPHRNSAPPSGDPPQGSGGWRRTALRWLLANSLLSGALALAWLLLRSGRRPSRFTSSEGS